LRAAFFAGPESGRYTLHARHFTEQTVETAAKFARSAAVAPDFSD
jgi:hypothetical protein